MEKVQSGPQFIRAYLNSTRKAWKVLKGEKPQQTKRIYKPEVYASWKQNFKEKVVSGRKSFSGENSLKTFKTNLADLGVSKRKSFRSLFQHHVCID